MPIFRRKTRLSRAVKLLLGPLSLIKTLRGLAGSRLLDARATFLPLLCLPVDRTALLSTAPLLVRLDPLARSRQAVSPPLGHLLRELRL